MLGICMNSLPYLHGVLLNFFQVLHSLNHFSMRFIKIKNLSKQEFLKHLNGFGQVYFIRVIINGPIKILNVKKTSFIYFQSEKKTAHYAASRETIFSKTNYNK